MLAAVILSGGASRRMGSPKALVPYQGRPFLEHLLSVTNHPAIGVRRVVLGPDAEAIAKDITLAPDEIVINHDWEKGQLSSIHAALKSLPANTDGILLCPVDHPLVSASLIGNLIDAFLATRPPIRVGTQGKCQRSLNHRRRLRPQLKRSQRHGETERQNIFRLMCLVK